MNNLVNLVMVVGLIVSVANVCITFPKAFFGIDRTKRSPSKREKWITPIMLTLYLIFAFNVYDPVLPVHELNLVVAFGTGVVTVISCYIYSELRRGRTL